MQKRYDLRKIKSKRSYSFNELSELLGVHIRTVQDWKKQGMGIIEGSKPFLVLGAKATEFLYKPKLEIKENEFYCLKCKKAVNAENVKKIYRNEKYKNGREAIKLQGNCVVCGAKVNRFDSEK